MLAQEAVILGVDAQRFVIGQVHGFGRLFKGVQLFFGDVKLLDDVLRHALLFQQFDGADGPAQVLLGDAVGVKVVVDNAGVFIRSGDGVNAELPVLFVAGIQPQPRRFHQYLRPHVFQEADILGGKIILDKGVGNVPR